MILKTFPEIRPQAVRLAAAQPISLVQTRRRFSKSLAWDCGVNVIASKEYSGHRRIYGALSTEG